MKPLFVYIYISIREYLQSHNIGMLLLYILTGWTLIMGILLVTKL